MTRAPAALLMLALWIAGLAALGAFVQQRLTVSSDRKSTRLNSSHLGISYAVFCLKKKNQRYGSSHIGATAKEIYNVVTDAASGVVDIFHGIDKAVADTWNNFWNDGKADGICSNLSSKQSSGLTPSQLYVFMPPNLGGFFMVRSFYFYGCRAHYLLLSFPTRRSSD